MSLDTLSSSSVPNKEVSMQEESSYFDSLFTSLMPMLLIFFVFYFFLIRPQDQKKKEQEDLIHSVKKGEDVITTSGICGKVVKTTEGDKFLTLEIAQNTHIKIMKSAIVDIVSRSKS